MCTCMLLATNTRVAVVADVAIRNKVEWGINIIGWLDDDVRVAPKKQRENND